MEGVRLNEPGDDGADEPGVALAVAEEVAAALERRAAATAPEGLQWAQGKILKPRPPQLVQIAPLYIWLVFRARGKSEK